MKKIIFSIIFILVAIFGFTQDSDWERDRDFEEYLWEYWDVDLQVWVLEHDNGYVSVNFEDYISTMLSYTLANESATFSQSHKFTLPNFFPITSFIKTTSSSIFIGKFTPKQFLLSIHSANPDVFAKTQGVLAAKDSAVDKPKASCAESKTKRSASAYFCKS